MRGKKERKPNPRPKIDYPPVPTKKWIPPDQRPKKKPKPAYVKPPGMNQPLKVSCLGRIWHNFRILEGRTFLLGGFSETHKRFRPKTNGFQTPCNCLIAAILSKIYDMAKWDRAIVDKTMEMGDKLYLKSVNLLGDHARARLKLSEVYPAFYLEDTKITATVHGDEYKGKLFQDFDGAPVLEDVVKDFFGDRHELGLILTQTKYMAFWAAGKSYYLYDPSDHSEQGLPWTGLRGRGFAVVLRLKTPDELVAAIHANVDQKQNARFAIAACSVCRMVKVNLEAPEGKMRAHCGDAEPQEPVKYVSANAPEKPPEPPGGAGEEEDEEEELGVADLGGGEEEEEMAEDPDMVAEEYCPDAEVPLSRTPSEYAAAGEEPPQLPRRQYSQSLIPIERAKAESVTYFIGLIPDKMAILRGSTHQADPRFTKLNGKQAAANAMAALATLRLHKSRTWFKKVVDEVLLAGEDIYRESARALPKDEALKAATVCPKIALKEREFAPDVEEYSAVGRLQSDKDGVLDLLPALKDFFRDNEACVLAGPLTLALWLEDGLFYMFDPNERDERGLAVVKSLQVGSDLQVLDYVPGVACVTRYTTLKDLVGVYMNNVDKPLRRDPFVISRVHINDVIVVPSPWHNFQGVARGKWILRGTFNENDRRFERETRNNQSTAAASLALAYSRLKHVRDWTTEDVDEVTIQGDALYKSCVECLKDANKFASPMLQASEVRRKFPLEGMEINLDIQDCYVNGLLDAKDDNDALNLRKGMREFFRENETGVLTTRSISVAVWKNEEVYYYYDSHSRDERGVINNYGTACILRILNVDDLARTIEANLEPDANNAYNISRVGVKVWEMAADGVVRPPLNNYAAVGGSAAILRSLLHERSPAFGLNRGKQTVPMCLAALGMAKVYPAGIWSRDVLDEAVALGDGLYARTMEERERNRQLPEEEDVDEVYPENCLLSYRIGVNGIALRLGEAAAGNFAEDFAFAMFDFFGAAERDEEGEEEDQRGALISSDVYTAAVWRENGVYFLFDPKPRDEEGQVFGKEEWTLFPVLGEGEEEEGAYGGEGSVYDEQLVTVTDFGSGDGSQMKRSVASQATEEGEDGPAVRARRHSAQYWRAMEAEGGRACAMWFTTVERMVDHVVENTPPTKRLDLTFKLIPVRVANKPELKAFYDPEEAAPREDLYAGDWYEFREVDHGRWILRGTMDFNHVMFPAHNRGRQSVAMCYAALAYAKRFAVAKFKPATVDDVLKYGDRLYSATRRLREKELRRNNRELRLSEAEMEALLDGERYGTEELARAFCIGVDQMRVEVAVEAAGGDVRAADDSEDPPNVRRALDAYFERHRSAILSSKNVTVAVWRGARVFYMFDPDSRGPNGVRCSNGEACITRYLEVAALADVFARNLTGDGRSAFVVHRVSVAVGPCPREPRPEEKERPELPRYNGYEPAMPGKAILRGVSAQDETEKRVVPGAPIAVVALAMSLVHKASTWTRPIVEEVTVIGEELYADTLDTLGFEFNPWEQGLTVHLVNKDFKVGVLKANVQLRTMDQRGVVDIKHPQVLNLRQGMERFFEENTHGIIETETLTVAIWEEEDQKLIYMFDPNPRGPGGYAQPGGTACVLSFETVKMACDHFVANVEKSKRTGEFVITPVELVVGNVRTKPKKTRDPCKNEKETERAPAGRRPTPCQARLMREIAEQERKRKQERQLEKIGKHEYHQFSNGDAILRGGRSQNSDRYSETSRNKQDLPNCLAAFVVNRLVPVPDWYYKHINIILDAGDQLYKDSYIVYEPSNPKLGLRNVLREFYVRDVQVSLVVYQPVMSNILTAYNLEVALINYFQQEQFGILSANEQHVALFFKTGLYYMFDPHDRDLEGNRCTCGCACVTRFGTLPNLVSKFMGNVVTMFDSIKMFKITLVTIGGINRIIDYDK